LNIDKVAMEAAWTNRSNPTDYRTLLMYIDEMAKYFASRLKINQNVRDDILQEVRIAAIGAIEKYQVARKSTVFSFFYRTIYTACIYFLRKDYHKSLRSLSTCSYDVVSNVIGDEGDSNPNEPSYMDREDAIIEVSGMVFNKEEILKAAVEAKRLYRKKDIKSSTIKDDLVRLCYQKLEEKSRKRKGRHHRDS